jgi:osmotically-inducible protein OsmY
MGRKLALLTVLALAACQPQGKLAEGPRTDSRPAAEQRKDESLKAEVARKLTELDRRLFRAVSVEAAGTRVLLTGAVVKPEQRRRAVQLAQTTEGVAEVVDELVVAEENTFDAYIPDAARERQVADALAADPRTASGWWVVRVVNGVVFLMGKAASPEQAEDAKAVVLDIDGVKWLVNHVKF